MEMYEASRMATDEILIQRVRMAITKAAVDVSAEDPDTVNHNHRLLLAYNVLNADSDMYARRFTWAACTNGTLQTSYGAGGVQSIPDGDLAFVVASVWDAIAGMY